MKTMTNIKEANFCKKLEPFFKMLAAEQHRLLAAPKHTRIAEAVDVLLKETHKLEDRAAAKGDVYLRRAVDKAIVQVHQIADVLESLEYELTEAHSFRGKAAAHKKF
jgi:hypothetical protein